ncbi:MAG: hypothetical protein F6J89_09480 [Symploca sp. SIO1C4]|uniref:Type I restriction modification DNA specificity domain-containing protein n=1 Tax=Symploca sp. SIO1C4 TaxID=2607765 RepID=A0A6B3NAC6_9CYAN|nr:hypothetical protein [Symploca sp. SIO1C4]
MSNLINVPLASLALNSGAFVDGPFGSNLKASEYVDDGIPVIRLQNIRPNRYDPNNLRFITKRKAESLQRHNYQAGDVVITKLGELCGVACQIPKNAQSGIIVADVVRFRGDSSRIDHRYLVHFLNSQDGRCQVSQLTKGTTRQRVNLSDFKKIQIPLPTLEEQRRIAAILDKADEVRRKRKQAIALTEELLRSLFLDMFGDPVTNPKGWDKTTFGDLVPAKGEIVDGPFGSSLKPECYVNNGIRVIRNFNIHDDLFDQSSFVYVTEQKFVEIFRSNVIPGDLLLSTKGTIGDICVMPELQGESVLSASGTVRIRLPGKSPLLAEFIVQQMVQASYKKYMKLFEAGTNQKYLNLSGIRKMELIVPPMQIQHNFVAVRENINHLKIRQQIDYSESNNLFNSILQKAFRGEL